MSHKLGEPISDDSSQDDTSQIRELEEEQGIFPHPEIDVPPTYDPDEDIPIKGTDPSYDRPLEESDGAPTPPAAVLAGAGTDPDDDDDGFSVQNRQIAGEAGHPFDEQTEDDDGVPIGNPMEYPPGSPPAYYSEEDTKGNHSASQANGAPRSSTSNSNANGVFAGMMLGNIAKPFEAMARKGKQEISDDDDEEYEEEQPNHEHLFASLTNDEKELWGMIETFEPELIELEPVLKPFLLEYIPAIGDIDAFIKIPRPDEKMTMCPIRNLNSFCKCNFMFCLNCRYILVFPFSVEDNLGLTQLDEPSTQQSDPTILDMKLRSAAKEISANHDAPVKRLERADKNSEQIEQWITNIKELHRSKPPDSVHYTKPMPDVEKLMQEWSPDFERCLHGIELPTADLDVDLDTFVDICLSVLDIPVHKSRVHSLHLLFSLYAEFKNSQHFRNLAQNTTATYQDTTDRLEL